MALTYKQQMERLREKAVEALDAWAGFCEELMRRNDELATEAKKWESLADERQDLLDDQAAAPDRRE
jgi:hypothetical protein